MLDFSLARIKTSLCNQTLVYFIFLLSALIFSLQSREKKKKQTIPPIVFMKSEVNFPLFLHL